MKDVLVKDLYTKPRDFGDESITVSGWIRTTRSSKKIAFIELNDGTYIKNIQVIAKRDGLDNYEDVTKLPISSTLKVTGKLVETPDAQQPFELHAEAIDIEGVSDPDFPLQKKAHSLEYLRTIAHLRPRTNTFYAVFKIRSLAAFAIHEYLQKNGFVYVNTPIITSSDTEGAGEMFRVTTLDDQDTPKTDDGKNDYSKDFFGEETNLTVSGQLQVEPFALAFRDVYTFGPTFRAEDSHTKRHAAEFWMIEPEMAFAELPAVLDRSEGLLKYVVQYLLDNASEDLQFLNDNVDHDLLDLLHKTVDEDFARITYTKAIELLEKADVDFKFPVKWGIDFNSEHEQYLAEKVFGKPVFVTDYPRDFKAFYMRDNEDGKTVAAVDLLVPRIGELIGGSQREEREDILEAKMKEFGLPREEYEWYLDLRKYGGTKHSGFGIGFERLLMYVTGMDNIRDVIPYPRVQGSINF
ncbi:asparagine--tRNA ligase [Lactobacillus sanfranciscensis]|uniref:Asparagine--tRNA ligase n=1 Tax=Fructilactobacillus sanfranciscensis (strain TMW 1.1304) TaxID=714313 RepID=G2KVH5_FRUST|nr:asparagine--tRNA ligase [Fructilactobacillus sanfranciscensis]AEN98990.1 Asparaginyl-tRNA synthetase [Fructilactobacillus sanfranciscensis TMW 1.1304]NDR75504.1 asparagine--tRNA ligase [Fructilactobacillus sanfranciscensis]NDR96261.1 asparagine--tRNA ligase [Fructilactobacillus sanfranciscensis]NDS04038.1 asparagine--tRNA ligase [Fructilactobacillus sanfranciscensis]POH19101.1 asparagine--tRNA ligase [Fructilactobacillus sanfranciscensis]